MATFTDNNPSAGNGSRTEFVYTFPVIQTEDVKVSLNGVTQATTKYTVDNVSNPTKITFNTTNPTSGLQVTSGTNQGAPLTDVRVRVYRETTVGTTNGNEDPKAVFAAGSSIRAIDLNANQEQSLMAIHELQDRPIETEDIQGDAITNAKIADNSIDSEHYVDGSIDLVHMSANSVDSDQYVDGSIDHVHLANDVIDGDNIQDDVINSEHYVGLSIDTEHIANENITTAKIANLNVTTSKIADLNVTRGKLEADAVDGTKLADNAVNTEHYTDNSIEHVHLKNDIIDGDNIQDDVVNSEHIAAGALDNEHYAAGSITSDKLNAATVITASEQGSATTNDTSFLTSAAADARFFNISSSDTIKDGQSFPDNDTTIATTAAINDRIIDIVNDVGGFDIIESEQHFPDTNPQGQAGSAAVLSIKAASGALTPSGTTLTITNGNLANNADITITGVTATIPSGFGFIVESTNTLHTYTFHRLVPNATEVTTVAGISSNVTTVAGVSSNVTTVAGISSNVTAVAGNATNINAVASNATNINAVAADASDIGVVAADGTDIGLVAGSITNVNNVSGSIASVNSAASNLSSINNFGDKYQVASSNPSTDGGGNALAAGDLYFNTSANELKVYNGSSWQGGVTASGSFAATTGNTFTGDNKYNDGVKLLVGSGSDLEIFHHVTNGSFINDAGTSTLKLQTGGSTKLEIQSTGIGVTGNITVSGNVDGRDVSADGTKLDGIATSATANPNAIDNVVEDTTPQLGGNLDVQTNEITTSTSNGNIKLNPNGTGVVEVKGDGSSADGTIQLNCSQNSHGVKIKSPAHSAGASYTLTLPTTDGNSNQVLKTDGSGNLSWVDQTTDTNTQLSTEEVQDIAGPLVATGGTKTGITVTYDDANGDMDFVVDDTTKLPLTGGTLTGNLILSSDHPKLSFTDTNHNPDFQIMNNHGNLLIYDETNARSPFNIDSSGNIQISGTIDGRDLATDGTKLDGIEASATADQTASEILTAIKTVDGAGSGLDADTVDGFAPTSFLRSDANDSTSHHITFNDSAKIKVGTGGDLEIYHDGNHSHIVDGGTGNLNIASNTTAILNAASNANIAVFKESAEVELYHNGTKMFETTSSGIQLAKNCQAPLSTLTDGSTITVDFSAASHYTVTLGGNRTFGNPSNVSNAIGSSGSIFIVQDGTGSRTAAFHADFKFAGGTDPTLTTTANAVDRIDYIVRAASDIHCVFTADVK